MALVIDSHVFWTQEGAHQKRIEGIDALTKEGKYSLLP